jgi:excisionase family DNA binding protein
MAKAFYTSAEAAAVLGITPPRVRQMVLAGEMEAKKHGRSLLILPEAIEQAKLRKTKPGPKKAATNGKVSTATDAPSSGGPAPVVGKPTKKGRKKGRNQ